MMLPTINDATDREQFLNKRSAEQCIKIIKSPKCFWFFSVNGHYAKACPQSRQQNQAATAGFHGQCFRCELNSLKAT